MINRFIEIDILYFLKEVPIIAIIGPRQVGKTTLAKKILKSINKEITYFDLESYQERKKLENPEFYLSQFENSLVVLDEIQNMPELFSVLRTLVDKKRKPGRFLILGSADPTLIKLSSESLAGRISYFELTPFNLLEINKKYKINKHWFSGGFPNSFLAKNKILSDKWMDDFVRTYVERDIASFGLSASPISMRRLWTMLAGVNGSILDMSSLAKSLSISSPTVSRYLDYLEGAFLIHRLPSYFINIKKRLVKTPKVYIRDSGILHYLLNISNYNELLNNLSIGTSWEGYVIEQIKQAIKRKYKLYFYRTHAGSEVDLVIEKGIKPIATVEIKFNSSPNLSKGNIISIQDLGTKFNFVIGYGADDYQIQKDITVCNLETFLNKYLPKI